MYLGWLGATTSDAISSSRAHVRFDKEAVGARLFIFIETSDIGRSSDWHHFFHLLFTKSRYDLVAIKGYCDIFQTKRSRCYIKHGVLPVEKLGQVKHWLCLFAQILFKVYLLLDLVLWDFREIQTFIAFSQQLTFDNPWHLLVRSQDIEAVFYSWDMVGHLVYTKVDYPCIGRLVYFFCWAIYHILRPISATW